jgi:ATP-binding protein involved in chromosome partitioning
MVTEQQIQEILDGVLVPGPMRSLVQMNLVREVAVSDQKARVNLASTALGEGTRDWVRAKVDEVIRELPDVEDVEIEFVEAKPPEVNQVRHVVPVMSGKGGVGKSLVSGLLGLSLARQGFEVGILDADITGPSIPRMFGMSVRPTGGETGIMPLSSKTGVEMMSINLLLPHEDDAVIWRGPLIARAITQFWEEVLWGKLDYLVVDLPPGTADSAAVTACLGRGNRFQPAGASGHGGAQGCSNVPENGNPDHRRSREYELPAPARRRKATGDFRQQQGAGDGRVVSGTTAGTVPHRPRAGQTERHG